MRKSLILSLFAALATHAAVLGCGETPGGASGDDMRVLVFSKTAGFRHASIPAGIQAMQELAEEKGFELETTEDSARFTAETLEAFDVVVFLNTTGDVLDAAQQEAFERFIAAGGGYVGIHGAADTEYDWPFYGELMGAYFRTHPAVQEATVRVLDREHPSTRHLPGEWVRTDEWYDYRSAPRRGVRVLAELDESTYTTRGEGMGGDHPIAWCHEFAGGRAWYTGGGHTNESFQEPDFIAHIYGGLVWAAGAEGDGKLTPTEPGLRVGEKAPDATVYTVGGEPVSLASLYAEGPVVVTFYRGGWCPYCTRALTEWESRTADLEAAGGRLIAITAEAPDYADETAGTQKLGFTVLSDKTMEAARAFKVFFAMDEGTIEKYRGFGLDLGGRNASGEWTLPAPGTFVIDTDGVVRFAYADWDYKKRADPGEVIAAVESLDD